MQELDLRRSELITTDSKLYEIAISSFINERQLTKQKVFEL